MHYKFTKFLKKKNGMVIFVTNPQWGQLSTKITTLNKGNLGGCGEGGNALLKISICENDYCCSSNNSMGSCNRMEHYLHSSDNNG